MKQCFCSESHATKQNSLVSATRCDSAQYEILMSRDSSVQEESQDPAG